MKTKKLFGILSLLIIIGVTSCNSDTPQDNVRQAEAELNTARANLEYAQNNYTRMQEAVKSDAVSRDVYKRQLLQEVTPIIIKSDKIPNSVLVFIDLVL